LSGTGLGLWVSQQIVERHGGSLRMHSSTNPPRTGTVVSILLPTDLTLSR
jgi:signal transduction histidine kinase